MDHVRTPSNFIGMMTASCNLRASETHASQSARVTAPVVAEGLTPSCWTIKERSYHRPLRICSGLLGRQASQLKRLRAQAVQIMTSSASTSLDPNQGLQRAFDRVPSQVARAIIPVRTQKCFAVQDVFPSRFRIIVRHSM